MCVHLCVCVHVCVCVFVCVCVCERRYVEGGEEQRIERVELGKHNCIFGIHFRKDIYCAQAVGCYMCHGV